MNKADFIAGLRSEDLADEFMAACAGSGMPVGHVRELHRIIRETVKLCVEFADLRERLRTARPDDEIDAEQRELSQQIARLQARADALKGERKSREGVANRLRTIKQTAVMFVTSEFVALATAPERSAAGLLLPGESAALSSIEAEPVAV